MSQTEPTIQCFSVPYHYDIYFAEDVFAEANTTVRDIYRTQLAAVAAVPTLVFLDDGLANCQPSLAERIEAYCTAHSDMIQLVCSPGVLSGGEKAKDGMSVPLEVIERCLGVHLCRHSVVWIVGGGALQDAAGLGIALFHRGARLIRFPSTVLSQNDSGVGVKNGVNLFGVKNLAGTFYPPCAVVNDMSLLRTLSSRDWVAGISEAFKVAAICDVDFLDWLVANADALACRDRAAMEQLIQRCACLHARHIVTSGDPFELGSARPLDFGHWAAHKLESMTRLRLRHGEAVAIGLSIDVLYAAGQGFVDRDRAHEFVGAMAACGLPVWDDALLEISSDGRYAVLEGLADFREHLGGQIHVTFPRPMGQRTELTEIDEEAMLKAILSLKKFAEGLGV